jgi:flagellar biosynthesis protein FlhG
MPDQAYDLRRLATHREQADSPCCVDRPPLLVVTGGKGGVGTTTVALNLAAALAESGKRTLLVDADPRGGDLAILCGIETRHTLADVIARRRTWNEAACSGPSGVRVIVGQPDWQDGSNSAIAAGRMLERLNDQDLLGDIVVIDAGNGVAGISRHVYRVANAVVMVTTADPASVAGAFAAIRAISSQLGHIGSAAPFYSLVNMTPRARVAETAHYRLARTCRRILGIELRSAGHLAIAQAAERKSQVATIGLNLQVSLADTVRRVFAAEPLSKWRKRIKFNGAPLKLSPNT